MTKPGFRLSDKFGKAINFIKGKSIITEKDFENFSKSLRRALLEADVALPVIKEFIKDIKERAVGQSVVKNFSSADSIAKVVKDVLIKILGDKTCQINIKDRKRFSDFLEILSISSMYIIPFCAASTL